MRYLELDLAIGITGWICDERRGAHLLPLDERNSCQPPAAGDRRPVSAARATSIAKPAGRRNEPAYLPYVAAAVAARGEPVRGWPTPVLRLARELFNIYPMISKRYNHGRKSVCSNFVRRVWDDSIVERTRPVRAHSQQVPDVRSAVGATRPHGSGRRLMAGWCKAQPIRDERQRAPSSRQDAAVVYRHSRRALRLRPALRPSGQTTRIHRLATGTGPLGAGGARRKALWARGSGRRLRGVQLVDRRSPRSRRRKCPCPGVWC